MKDDDAKFELSLDTHGFRPDEIKVRDLSKSQKNGFELIRVTKISQLTLGMTSQFGELHVKIRVFRDLSSQ